MLPPVLESRKVGRDERGSIVALSDSAGNVVAVNRYDEYGVPASGNSGFFQYAGQPWLAGYGAEVYYSRARMYDPRLGRFLQTDPIGYDDGMNMYAYVGGDPVNRVDPSGLLSCNTAESRMRQCWRDSDDPPALIDAALSDSPGGSPFSWSATATTDSNPIVVTGTRTANIFNVHDNYRAVELFDRLGGQRPWTNADFTYHYYYGGGEPVDLAQVGLGDVFKNAPPVQALVGEFRRNLLFMQPPTLVKFRTYINMESYIYALGNTQLYMAGMCQRSECFMRYGVSDWFRDPLSLGFETGGIPYRIRYEAGEVFTIPAWAR
jgi:RHS repeat-associated protein